MTTEGRKVHQAVDQVRTLCAEIALLLSTAEAFLVHADWVPEKVSPAAGGSTSIDYPRKWVPESVHRFLRHSEHKGLLAFVSVVLENLEQPSLLEEPLVTAGWIDFGDSVPDWWYPDISRWHLYNPKRSNDGTANVFTPNENFARKAREEVLRACTLGAPLVAITNAEALEERIIRPLLASLPGSAAGLAP